MMNSVAFPLLHFRFSSEMWWREKKKAFHLQEKGGVLRETYKGLFLPQQRLKELMWKMIIHLSPC